METEEKEERVRLGSYGGCEPHDVTLRGLTDEENETVIGMTHGQWWVRVNEEGCLESSPAWEALPSPTEDEKMMPIWQHPDRNGKRAIQLNLLQFDMLQPCSSPSISIQSLCGYYFTPENYQMQAERLESYGFECLRSQRSNEGQFWEIWFLPGLWCAKGKLKEAITAPNDVKRALGQALNFLKYNVSFGTLDVAVQRLAMPAPE